MMKVNCFVVSIAVVVHLGSILGGQAVGGFNGVLEMNGFKSTFTSLYNSPTNGSMSSSASSDVTSNLTQGCSSGNGASSDSLIGIIVSTYNIGNLLGSLGAGWLSDQFGRTNGLAVSGVLLTIGAAFLSVSYFVWMLIIGRLVSGAAIGIIYTLGSLYVAEMTPKESRGMLTSAQGPLYSLGTILALLTNIGFAKFDVGWRIVFAVIAVSAPVYAIVMKLMPHSPRWLVKKGRDQEALLVLSKINHLPKKEMFVETCLQLEELREVTRADSKNQCRLLLKELFQKRYLTRLLLSVILFFIEAMAGSFVYYYSTTIFCEVGVSTFVSALVVGLMVITASIVLTLFVDKLGRKMVFLLCTVLIFTTGLSSAVLTHLHDPPGEVVGYIVVVLLCLYAFGFSCSWLTLPWVVSSEIFPINIRGVAVSISTGSYALFTWIANLVTPLIVGSPLQLHGFFYILSAINLFSFFFVLFALPETKGVSLEHMDALFSQSIWERFIGTLKCSWTAPSTQTSVKEKEAASEESVFWTPKAQEDFKDCEQ